MALPPVGTVLIFLVTLTACKADAGEQQQARAARRRREWIVPPIKLLENADLTERESIAKIWSDKNINAKLRYFLGGAGADKDPVNLFIVNEATGFVRITGILDREQIPVYNLEGMAKFLNGTTAEKNINLHIEVEDENDNPPKFTRTSGSVKESSKPGTFILQVNATDADEPGTPHTQIAYRIVKQEPPDTSLMFHLEEETGRLYVKEPSLDREKHGVYTLVVEGVDMAGAPNGNTGTGTVQVSVLDINDNIPTLEKDEYEATVDEDTANVEVLRMKAFDVDLENSENWLAHFEIVSGNEDGVFSIETDPKTNEGVLILNKPVDYEMVKEVDLGVAVRNVAPLHVGDAGGAESGAGGAGGAGGADGGGAGGGSWVGGGVGSSTSGFMNFGNTGPGGKTYAVKVNVKNLPDGPGFSPKVKPIPVSEDPKALTVRSVIATYPAVDGDTGKPAENVRYAKSYDPDNWISVDEKTAEIKLNKHPDRESKFLTNGTYYAKIICMTEELPSKTSTGTIALQVQDANDHCPQLTARNQSLCTGDRLVTVTAVDEDFEPNAAPFQFTVVPEGTSKEWEVESYNDTSVVLKKHSGVWPGLYKLTLEIKDQQGVACPDKQVLQLDVCTCTEEGSCTLRGAQASSAKMGFLGIGAVLPGLLLLLLVPLLLLFCTCGGPGDMIVEDFTDMPFDVKEYLIPYHTEGMGEDKEVPLLSAPPLAAQEQVFIDHLDTKTSTVKLGSPADIYPSGRRDSAQKGPTGADFLVGQDSTVRKYRSGRFFCSETPAIGGDIYSEISLPDAYLKEYYSQKASCAAEAQACLDSVTAYCYEGVGSPVGSVGCCSLNDADDNLDFLADLDPKFMTLAEICRGTEGGAEDSPGALKPSDEQSSVMNHPITTTSVDHSTPRLALVSSEEKVVETSCSPTCVQRQAVLPCQQYLIQQPVYYGTPPVLQTTPYILEPQVHNTVLVSELPAVPNLQAMFVIDGVADYESIEMEKNVFLGPANHGGVFLVQPGNLSRGDNVVLAERNNISGLVVEQGNVGQNQGPAIVDNLPRSQNIMVAEEKPDAGQVLQGRPLWIHQREDIPVQQPVLLVERPIVQEGTPRLSPEASPGGPFSDNVLLVDKPNSTVGTPAGMKPVLDTKSKENKLQDRNVTDAEQEGQSSAWQVNQGEPSLVSQDVMQMEHLSEPQHSFQVEKDESTEQTGQDKFGVTTPVRDAESRASDTNVIGKTEQKLCDLEMSYCTIEGSGSVEANENTPELVPQNIKNVKMDTNYHQTAVEHSSELLQDPCEDELPTVCNKNLVSSESEPSLHQISDEEAAGPEMLEANSVEKCFITYENWEEDVQGVKTNPDGSNCLSVEENWPIAQEILEENGSVSEETLGEEQLSSSHSEELLKSREDASQAIECDADMDSSNSETDELERREEAFCQEQMKTEVSSAELQDMEIMITEAYAHEKVEEISIALTMVPAQEVELCSSEHGIQTVGSAVLVENIYQVCRKPLLEAELSAIDQDSFGTDICSARIVEEDESVEIQRKVEEEELSVSHDEEMEETGTSSDHSVHIYYSQGNDEGKIQQTFNLGGTEKLRNCQGVSRQTEEDDTSDSGSENADSETSGFIAHQILLEPGFATQITTRESETSGSSCELAMSEETGLLGNPAVTAQVLEREVPVPQILDTVHIQDSSSQVAEDESSVTEGILKEADLSSTDSEEQEMHSEESAVQEHSYQVTEGEEEKEPSCSGSEELERCQLASYQRAKVDEQENEVQSLEIIDASETDSEQMTAQHTFNLGGTEKLRNRQGVSRQTEEDDTSDSGSENADSETSGFIAHQILLEPGFATQITTRESETSGSSCELAMSEETGLLENPAVTAQVLEREVPVPQILDTVHIQDSSSQVAEDESSVTEGILKEADLSSTDSEEQEMHSEESAVQEHSYQVTEGEEEKEPSCSGSEELERRQLASYQRAKVDEQENEVQSLEIIDASETDSEQMTADRSMLAAQADEVETDSSQESDGGYVQDWGKHASEFAGITARVGKTLASEQQDRLKHIHTEPESESSQETLEEWRSATEATSQTQETFQNTSGLHYIETAERKADSLQTPATDRLQEEQDVKTEREIEGTGSAASLAGSHQVYEQDSEEAEEVSEMAPAQREPQVENEAVGPQTVNLEGDLNSQLRFKRAKPKTKKLMSPTRRCSQQ